MSKTMLTDEGAMKKRFRGDLVEHWNQVLDGVQYKLELEIDRKWLLAQLGPRAIRSSGKKASQVAGAVVVRVIK